MADVIRILFTIPNFITAGSGGAMLSIIERLDRSRFSPSVCVRRKGGALDQRVDDLEIPFLEMNCQVAARPFRSLLARCREAASSLWNQKFHLWHSFDYSDDYSEPLVARYAGAKAWIYTKKNMGWGTRSWHLRTLLAGRVVAENTTMMEEFFGRFPYKGKAHLIPRGVDTTRFSLNVPARLRLRSWYQLAEKVILVGCVAQLVPVKGHITLLKALAECPSIHLMLAGHPLDKAYSEELHKIVSECELEDRVHFLGGIIDVPAFHAECDIFVLPTNRKGEGCGVATLEAMASGKACIVTDVPGSRDLLENNRTGLVVPPEDTRALAKALAFMAEKPGERIRLGKAARERVQQRYTIEQETAEHEQMYLNVMRSTRGR